RVPIPPGWVVRSYSAYECQGGGAGVYAVGLFPPDVYVPPEYPWGKIHEFMKIYLPLCPLFAEVVTADRPAPEPGGIQVGATRVPCYVSDGYEWISRYAYASFGGQAYLFDFGAMPQDKGLRYLPLFHGLLAGFTYAG